MKERETKRDKGGGETERDRGERERATERNASTAKQMCTTEAT
jgi:hypothetical protein